MALKTYALTTVARAAAYMEITPTAAQETLIETLINAATDQIEKYIGYRVKKTTYTSQELDSQNGSVITLEAFPIDSGSSFSLQRRNSSVNEDEWETIDTQYYHIDYDAGILYATRGNKFAPTSRGYRVTYSAGYDYNNTSTYLSDVEGGAALELACWMLVAELYNRNRRLAVGDIKRESIDKYSVEYADNGSATKLLQNTDITDLLDNYRRIDFAGPITPLQT